MLSRIITTALFIFGLVCCLPSCRPLRPPGFYGIGDLQLDRVSFTESNLRANLYFSNPNAIGARIREANGKVWMDDNYLGEFNLDTLISVPAKADFIVPVNLKVDMKKLLQNSFIAFLSDSVTFTIDGQAKVGKGGIFKKYPITYKGKQSLKELINGVRM